MTWGTAATRDGDPFGAIRVAPMLKGQVPSYRPVGGLLGPYRLLCELASVDPGVVYVAQRRDDAGIELPVALKTISFQVQDRRAFADAFLSEARVLAAINHPYVCKLWDVGSHDGAPYLALEYLVGEPLSRLFPLMSANQSDFSTGCLVRSFAKLCEGLHAAHQAQDEQGEPLKLVHGGLCLSSLCLLYDGTVRISDFGARGAKGHCAYMSPEQVRGLPVDLRTDIWSLGVVAWEMLTGRPLFSHESETKAMVGVELGKLEPPSRYNSFVPPELDEIIVRALRRHPDDRFQDALAFGTALENLASTHFAHVPRCALGGWLESMFPGSREYRQRIAGRIKAAEGVGVEVATGADGPPKRPSLLPVALQSVARWLRGVS